MQLKDILTEPEFYSNGMLQFKNITNPVSVISTLFIITKKIAGYSEVFKNELNIFLSLRSQTLDINFQRLCFT